MTMLERFGPYRVLTTLGSGISGTVHHVVDERSQVELALKVTQVDDGDSLTELRREFQLVSGLLHPNLVRFRQLSATPSHWLLAMDLIRGRDIATHASDADVTERTRAIRGLVGGVEALHRAGIVHGDLKPGNVLVDERGVTRILDFGFASLASRADPNLGGTIEFMAPEVLAGGASTPASDWYAVGVLLWSISMGRSPFTDISPSEAKLAGVLPEARLADPGLDELCRALMASRPEDRPSGAEVADQLRAPVRPAVGIAPRNGPLVGRARELDRLTGSDAPRICWVHGPSGVGKSALVDAVTRELDCDVVVGRCLPRQAVPYAGVGALVDQLVELARLREVAVPPDLGFLFPWLGTPAAARGGASERRARGFAAIRSLLALLATAPLVLVLEDAHWSGPDTARLLTRALDALPRVRLVVTSRNAPDAQFESLEPVAVPLRELTEQEAMELVQDLPTDRGRAIVRSAGGNPFLLERLATLEKAGADATSGLLGDLGELSEGADELLRVVALSAEPLREPVIADVLEVADPDRLLQDLVTARLASVDASGIYCYHDRIGRAVLDGVGHDEVRRLHAALVRGWRRHGARPAALAEHLEGAGSRTEACRMFARAADEASRAHAFEQAESLTRRAQELQAGGEPWFLVQRARYLSSCGRGRASAALYQELAERIPEHSELFERFAAEQLLTKGHFESGVTVLQQVVRSSALRWPGSETTTLLWMLVEAACLALRIPPLARSETSTQTCWTAARGLMALDPTRGAYFMVHGLRQARSTGDPAIIARFGAIVGAVVLHPAGGPFVSWAERLLAEAEATAIELGDAALHGLIQVCKANRDVLDGRWSQALALAEDGLARLPPTERWAINLGQMAAYRALEELGRHQELSARLDENAEALAHRGDRYAWLTAQLYAGQLDVLLGRTDRREQRLLAVREALPSHFLLQHFYLERLHVRWSLFDGCPEDAAARFDRLWHQLQRSGLMRLAVVAHDGWLLRATVELANGDAAAARQSIRKLSRVRNHASGLWADALAALVEAPEQGLPEVAERFEREGHVFAASLARARAGAQPFEGHPSGLAAYLP